MNFLTKTIFLLSLIFLPCTYLKAQHNQSDVFNIQGTVLGNGQIEIAGAGIKLTNSKSNQYVLAITDSKGRFSISNLKKNNYLLQVTFIGLKDYLTTIDLNSDTILKDIYLINEEIEHLQDVIVIASKEDIQQKGDRIVVNVENSPIMTGSSALEILRKSPGVAIGSSGNISLKGRQGVMVMINDKPIRLSGSELAEYLQGISAINISKVELINSPPAKYEASGASGIINIKLKRDTKVGLNGNVSLNNGFGKYIKTNNGVNINYSKEILSLNANYNYARRGDFVYMDIHRTFSNPSQEISLFSQDYDQKNNYSTHSSRIAVDYHLSKKLDLGAEVFANFNTINRKTNSISLKDQITQDAFNTTLNERNSYGVNLNGTFKLDTLGSYLNADTDYSWFNMDDIQTYDIQYSAVTPNSNILLSNNGKGGVKIKSTALNYMGYFKNFLKIESGLKFVTVNSSTQIDFFDNSTGSTVYDSELSSQFLYHESIYSAFVSIHKKTEKLEMNGGFRYEKTRINANEIDNIHSFKVNYNQLFPSASLTYKVQKDHLLTASFNRRIQRPGYGQINPFFYFLDLNTRFSGSPGLRPTTNFSYELTYTFRDKYSLSTGYSVAKDAITDIQVQDNKQPDILIQQPVNIENYKVYSINTYLPLVIAERFKSSNSIGLYLSSYSGEIGKDQIENTSPYLMINSTNTLLIKNWTLQLNGSYEGKQFYGNSMIEPLTILSLGIQKKVLAKKATLSMNINDPLGGNRVNSSVSNDRYSNKLLWRRDSRTVIFGFSWKFGSKPKMMDRKKSSAEEEKRRAG